jgi:hypothetical protein
MPFLDDQENSTGKKQIGKQLNKIYSGTRSEISPLVCGTGLKR